MGMKLLKKMTFNEIQAMENMMIKYKVDEQGLIDLIFKNLTAAEKSLLRIYSIECNENYQKTAKKLNSSTYITKKELKRIIEKVQETYNKL